MAGDWIKMRTNLWDHPKVVRIVSAICPQGVRDVSARCRVIGALYRTWALADTHADDGVLDGYDAVALNTAIGIDGWAENLQHVGWLVIESQRLILPRFDEHNGASAKRRSEDSSRKRRVRNLSADCPQNVRKMSAKNRTREEKRREENTNTPKPPFTTPTVDQVKAYCDERNNGIDAQQFVDHYTSNGWRVGRTSMKDWQAAVRTWERNDIRSTTATKAIDKTCRPLEPEEFATWNPVDGGGA